MQPPRPIWDTRRWTGSVAVRAGCYADCDDSGTLDRTDYACFQSRFATRDPYADCDQNGTHDVQDYICYQTQFARGCQ